MRKAVTSSSSIIARTASSETASIFCTSLLVRKPSKKWMNGTRDLRVEACATSAMSMASCTELLARRANPVWRTAITSPWSPKMESPWHARALAETWNTTGVSSPAILYIVGIISRSPWDAVKVVVRAPVWSAPWTAAAAPASLCISCTSGTVPQRFFRPLADHSSDISPMVLDGVMGYMAMTSLSLCAIVAAASLPSIVTIALWALSIAAPS